MPDSASTRAYVLDTNVLVHDPEALTAFEEHTVFIPIQVVEELDDLKKGKNAIGQSARLVLKQMDRFREGGDIVREGVPLPNGGRLRLIPNTKKCKGLDRHSPDNAIVGAAVHLNSNGHKGRTILVSKDAAVRLKAEYAGVPAQNYRRDRVEGIDRFGRILSHDAPVAVDSTVYRRNSEGVLERWRGKEREREIPLHKFVRAMGICGQNDEQRCALDALLDKHIDVMALTGIAGGGKTILALAAGLEQVDIGASGQQLSYDQVLVGRPIVPMGNDLGFLPGDVREKMDPWMQPIYDNLDVLVKTPPEAPVKRPGGRKYKNPDYLVETGLIKIEPLTYIRGRSLPRRFIIIDEAQNLRPLDVKTIVTRCGEGSKIVLTGDLEQIDHPYLDARTNGLAHLIGRFIGERNFCYMHLWDSARSAIAEQGARLL